MIKDEFGNKIGGSHRDMWKLRGLMIDDLEEMNEREKKAYVTKDNIWPKPDYYGLKEDGIPVPVLYYRKLVRDAVSIMSENYEDIINNLTWLKETVNELKTEAEVAEMLNKVQQKGWAYKDGYFYVIKEPLHALGSRKLFSAIATNTCSLSYLAAKKQFLMSDLEKASSKLSIFPKFVCTIEMDEGRTKLSKGGSSWWMNASYMPQLTSLEEDGYIAISSYPFKLFTAATREELDQKLLDDYQSSSKQRKPSKEKFLYKELDSMEQTGKEEIIFSKTGEDYINDFKFYGGEFGTWLSEEERQKNLDMGYLAFKHLAIALDIKPEQVALNERLSIAFGARGRGKALAHYEPLRRVINLTKWKGAGSLAHEYGHALDHIFGELTGTGAITSYNFGNKLYALTYSIVNAKEYYRNSRKFDGKYAKDGGYWASPEEMFARAFACYVKDKLTEKGIVDQYLCGHAESCYTFTESGEKLVAYPVGQERKEINEAFDKLISTLKTIEL